MSELLGPYLSIPKGDGRNFTLGLVDKNGDAYDLTGATEIEFVVAESDTDGAVEVFSCTLTAADVEKVGNDDEGVIKILVASADTSSATIGSKVYQVKITPASGGPHRSVKGEFEIQVSHG